MWSSLKRSLLVLWFLAISLLKKYHPVFLNWCNSWKWDHFLAPPASPTGCQGQVTQTCALQAAAVKAGVHTCVQAPFREMLVTRVKLEDGGKRGIHRVACLWGDVASLHQKPDRQTRASELGRRTLSGRDWELDMSAWAQVGQCRLCSQPSNHCFLVC